MSSKKFILTYARDNNTWNKIIESEIESFLNPDVIVFKFDKTAGLKRYYYEKMISYAYSIHRPGIFVLSQNRRINLWKAVHKAAYGYPVKLNNLKQRLKENHEKDF